MKKGLLIILSGPSGVGKGTLRKQLMNDKSLNLVFSVSMTTRPIRDKEVDGVDYYFVSKEQFDDNLARGNFLEHCEFVGNCYGTPKDKVEELRNSGKNVLLEIEINGATQVMSKVKDEGVISIFLMPPSLEALEERIRKRKSETEEVIQKRLIKGANEMLMASNYDYVVLNDHIKNATDKAREIIKNKIEELNK